MDLLRGAYSYTYLFLLIPAYSLYFVPAGSMIGDEQARATDNVPTHLAQRGSLDPMRESARTWQNIWAFPFCDLVDASQCLLGNPSEGHSGIICIFEIGLA